MSRINRNLRFKNSTIIFSPTNLLKAFPLSLRDYRKGEKRRNVEGRVAMEGEREEETWKTQMTVGSIEMTPKPYVKKFSVR